MPEKNRSKKGNRVGRQFELSATLGTYVSSFQLVFAQANRLILLAVGLNNVKGSALGRLDAIVSRMTERETIGAIRAVCTTFDEGSEIRRDLEAFAGQLHSAHDERNRIIHSAWIAVPGKEAERFVRLFKNRETEPVVVEEIERALDKLTKLVPESLRIGSKLLDTEEPAD